MFYSSYLIQFHSKVELNANIFFQLHFGSKFTLQFNSILYLFPNFFRAFSFNLYLAIHLYSSKPNSIKRGVLDEHVSYSSLLHCFFHSSGTNYT